MTLLDFEFRSSNSEHVDFEAPCVIGDTKYVSPTSFHVTSAFARGVEESPLPFGDERWHYRSRQTDGKNFRWHDRIAKSNRETVVRKHYATNARNYDSAVLCNIVLH